MKNYYILLLLSTVLLFSCKKWLDIKSNLSDVTPGTLEDYQAMADNDAIINTGTPGLALNSSDNFYVTYTTWQSLNATGRNCYTWTAEVYEGASPQDWSWPYKSLEMANIILEGIASIPVTQTNQAQWNNVKGSALFIRAMVFYHLAQTFAPSYTASTAPTDLGIPLRLTTDVNIQSTRASVEQTYQQIIADLTAAENLLPIVAAYQTRPSKPALYGLLAKTYLNMGNYTKAQDYANKALTLYSSLLDYNGLTASSTAPLPVYPNNTEIIYYTTSFLPTILFNNSPITDSLLYQSYSANDLRKTVCYRLNTNLPIFKGFYTGKTNSFFSGIATNELYLIRAEANARLNNTAAALTDLNTLLQKRWKTGSFIPVTAVNADDALAKILTERRKELPFTGSTRWEDLRRLNKEPAFAKTLTRVLNNQTYTLSPNDPKYTLPIPDDEIRLSGIKQNIR